MVIGMQKVILPARFQVQMRTVCGNRAREHLDCLVGIVLLLLLASSIVRHVIKEQSKRF